MHRLAAALFVALLFSSVAARAGGESDSPTVGPGPLSPSLVPEALKPWIGWSLRGHEDRLCPAQHGLGGDDEDGSSRICLWPARLSLVLDAHGGTFSQSVRLYRDALVPLPGDETAWPQEVRVDGQSAPVVEAEGGPAVSLSSGEHALSGRFAWHELPESIHVPKATGLVSLSLRGKEVPFASRDADGLLWLQREESEEQGEARLDVKVWRRVIDEVPLRIDARIQLEVSGKNREVLLGRALLEGFTAISLDSQLPARLEPDGRLRVQVRPGTFRIELIARHRGPVSALSLASDSASSANLPDRQQPGRWAPEEVWVFAAQPELRVAEISGVPAVDPTQTTLPQEWRNLPAYRVRPGDTMQLAQQRRGDADPAPDQLTLSRTLWLDFDGQGATARDQLSGTLTRSDRLEMPAPSQLGRVRAQGKDQLITRLAPQAAPGVELRQGQLFLSAESRTALQNGMLDAVGWAHGVRALSATLNLPPGWRLLHASGVDDVSTTWLQGWSLLDLFLLLLAALAVGKLFGWPLGLGALAALGLTLPEGGPKWLWLLPLAAEALVRVVPAGRVQTGLRWARSGALLALLLALVPFAVTHLRTGIYPALERQLTLEREPMHEAFEERVAKVANASEPATAQAPPPPAFEQEDRDGVSGSVGLAMGSGSMKADAKVARSKKMLGLSSVLAAGGELPGAGSANLMQGQAYRQQLDLSQIDPNAVAQTGPGLPSWSWRTVSLRWSGPVEAGARVHLWLLSPRVNLMLAILRVLLVALLWFKLFAPRRGGLSSLLSGIPVSRAAGAALVVLSLLSPASRASEIPTDERLDQLRERLTAAPLCGSHCAATPHLLVEAAGSALKLHVQIDAAAPVAVPLPGALGHWSPESVLLDGKPATALSRSEDGTLWLALTTGTHQLLLEGALPARDEVQLALPLKPKQLEARLSGWTLDGLHDDGTAEENLQLVRVQRGAAKSERLEPGQLPPFLEVQRAILLGLTWQISTRVTRRSPEGAPITVEVPLLPGESITSADVRMQDGKAQVALGPHTNEISWTSSIPVSGKLALKAADDPAFTEVWHLEVAPTWHVEAKGIPPVHQEPSAQRVPAYRPWPGESLELTISRPEPVSGATLTIQSTSLSATPGARTTDATLSLSLSTGRGGPTSITLPEQAELQSLSLDGRSLPLHQEGRAVSIDLSPGEHRAQLEWREPRGLSLLYRMPTPDLGRESVNALTELHLPGRWVLLTGGPRLGPAVLIWGFALVMLLCAFGLSRLGTTPLRTHQWALLALGLTQVDVVAAAIVAGWLLVLGWRRNVAGRIEGARRFDLMQLALIVWTLVTAGVLIASIERGLLGEPQMQVAGNDSSASLLRWFVDRSGPSMPGAWALTLPMLAYRIAMLAWALWLALAMVRWLPWAWESFSSGGLWRAVPKQAPAVATATSTSPGSAAAASAGVPVAEIISTAPGADSP